MRTAVAGLTASVALVAMPVSAQSSLSARPGHGFAAVGVVVPVGGLNDPIDGVSSVDQYLLVSGVVFVAPHVGVGIERLPEHDTAAPVGHYLSFDESEQVREKSALMFTARGRALTRTKLALDGVFGVGALHLIRTSTTVMRFPPSGTHTTSIDTKSAGFSVGADAVISVASHVAVVPQVRWYFRRVGDQSFPTNFVLEPGAFFAFDVGVTAGVTW